MDLGFLSMIAMPDPEPPLNPPASVAAKLEIPEGTFVLTYDKLNSERIIRSVQEDTAGAIAVFIGTTRNSFQGEPVASPVFCPFHADLRSDCDAIGIPSVQQNGYENDEDYFSNCSRERDTI